MYIREALLSHLVATCSVRSKHAVLMRTDCIGMFGWNVSHVHQLPVAIQVPNAKRIERSIYALSTTDIALDLEGDAAAKMHNT
jgi:hypothetical protein